ncbi:uncharacterized protein TNCV_153221 [Trichonephila clavipes]|nr:uncharacterized protein TNCV_153221 [Trichonephila clavipes]
MEEKLKVLLENINALKSGQNELKKRIQKCQEDLKNTLEEKINKMEDKIIVFEEKMEKKMEEAIEKPLQIFSENVREKISLKCFVDGLMDEEIQRGERMTHVQDLKSALLFALKFEADIQASCIDRQSIRGARFFSNVRLEKLNTVVKKDTSAIGNYILVDFNQVNNLLRSAKCQYCEKQTLKLELGAKLGFSYNLKVLCSNCDENKTVVNTSLKSVQTSHDVNLRITQAFSHIGKGYSAIEKFCMVMNIDPFSSTTYGKCARRLDNAYTLASENIFAEIHREIKNVYENGAEITDLSVSFDGTWLTRGHTSLIGVGCVIDMLTGYVVDFEVMSKVCSHCSVAKK